MSTVVYLPFAGAGASVFRAWNGYAADRFTPFAVQLPGREERFIEAPLQNVQLAADDAAHQIRQAVPEGEDIVVFGHSLGAVLAFEVAKRIEDDPYRTLIKLFVSGSPGPWAGRTERASRLDDDGFLDQVRRFAGYDHPALAVPELRELLLPMLRADVTMHESYIPNDTRRINVPIVTLRGSADELVSANQARQWDAATTDSVRLVEFDGPHMYLVDAAPAVADLIAAELPVSGAA